MDGIEQFQRLTKEALGCSLQIKRDFVPLKVLLNVRVNELQITRECLHVLLLEYVRGM